MTVKRDASRWEVWRSPLRQPPWARPVLLAITAVVAFEYAWGLASQQPEIYYAAAVRSMASSWHDFLFAAFDPAATVSIDKLPGALWIQALSVRMFGVHVWALNLPQVIEGSLTVLVLYRAIRRFSGVTAAMVAVTVYACMPATVALNRGNISDTLLILLLVGAVDAIGCAVRSGHVSALLCAGLFVGLAFQTKMLEAWLVVPVLLLVWLLAAPTTLLKRLAAAAAMIGVIALVSLSWMLVVSAVPQQNRPYVDGSSHDSLFEQVFDYNGLGRADPVAPAAAAGAQSITALTDAVTLDAGSPADRIVAGPGGRAIGWLMPTAVAGLLAGLWATRRRRRGDPFRAGALLWAGWLLIDVIAFSVTDTINAYYLAALTPPIAALTGIAVTTARRGLTGHRSAAVKNIVLAVAAATVIYGNWLLAPAPTALRITAVIGALGSCIFALTKRRRATATLAAVLIAPALAVIALVAEHGGPFITPFEPPAARAVTQAFVASSISQARTAMTAITAANPGVMYPAATYTSLLAAPFIFATGIEVLPIGGFRGTAPAPTLAQLIANIKTGRLHTVLLLPAADDRVEWVTNNCLPVPSSAPGIQICYCR